MNVATLNPKAVTLRELYGSFDALSHEWHDGLLAVAYRSAATHEGAGRQWIVFDGPVDAIWVESLNTVLDDNRKLCLTTGEIIKMSRHMSIVFEVEDLAVASPATVSRVGIIYLEPDNVLGWQALIDSFFVGLPEELAWTAAPLGKLVGAFMPRCLAAVRELREMVPTSDMMLVASFIRLLECLLSSEGTALASPPDEQAHVKEEKRKARRLQEGAVRDDGRLRR